MPYEKYEKHDEYKFGTTGAYIYQKGRSALPLTDFLDEKRPSNTKDTNGKHWIVVLAKGHDEDPVETARKKAEVVEEGKSILAKLSRKRGSIEEDSEMKKKEKKENKQGAEKRATKALETLAENHGMQTGYWTFENAHSTADKNFKTLATSLLEGPLKKSPALLVRVSTTPLNVGDKYKHLLQVGFNDVYDEAEAKRVLYSLVDNHGMRPHDCRSELYDVLGLKGKEGLLPPHIHLPAEFYEEASDLKEAFEKGKERARGPLSSKKKKRADDNDSDDDDDGDRRPSKEKRTKLGMIEEGQALLEQFGVSSSKGVGGGSVLEQEQEEEEGGLGSGIVRPRSAG